MQWAVLAGRAQLSEKMALPVTRTVGTGNSLFNRNFCLDTAFLVLYYHPVMIVCWHSIAYVHGCLLSKKSEVRK